MEINKIKLPIAGGVVVVIVLGLAIWYWSANRQTTSQPEPKPITTADDAIEAATNVDVKVPSNPVENKVPELNPVDRANPFKESYKNPFE